MASSIDRVTQDFTTAISCLDHALRHTPIGLEKVRLGAVKLRLTRWGEAVDIYDPVALGLRPGVDHEDVHEATNALAEIAALVERALEGPQHLPLHLHGGDMRSEGGIAVVTVPEQAGYSYNAVAALQQEMEMICQVRFRGQDIRLMASGDTWQEMSQSPSFFATEVAERTTKLIADLESCFPAAAKQRMLCEDEMRRLQYLEPQLVRLVRIHACWPPADPPLNDPDVQFWAVVQHSTSGGCVCM
ncbi:hypothetical protein QBC47DRAFT_392144 [Echria macrotheca]|uniref:Prion-inhibition and propagation HeLo domain-containing protein n=1 Tax=Echria macrotheca TaxID=438768 RepID=A0AAJ0F1C6_9PEZI|nr:hypothetical protein QBC47DRAFT_392144 [Echria macrotheca]